MLPIVRLRIPKEFGALCGDPNAYCLIKLPYCPETKRTLVELKADPGRVMRRIKTQHSDFARNSMLESIDKVLADPSVHSGYLFRNPVQLFEAVLIPALMHSEKAKVQTSWRRFSLRTDSQRGMKSEFTPSAAGLYLDVSIRDFL